jgi:hypothetical protein
MPSAFEQPDIADTGMSFRAKGHFCEGCQLRRGLPDWFVIARAEAAASHYPVCAIIFFAIICQMSLSMPYASYCGASPGVCSLSGEQSARQRNYRKVASTAIRQQAQPNTPAWPSGARAGEEIERCVLWRASPQEAGSSVRNCLCAQDDLSRYYVLCGNSTL